MAETDWDRHVPLIDRQTLALLMKRTHHEKLIELVWQHFDEIENALLASPELRDALKYQFGI